MPRIQINDVVSKEKRTIRNIPISHSNRKKESPSVTGSGINIKKETPKNNIIDATNINYSLPPNQTHTQNYSQTYSNISNPITKERERQEYFREGSGDTKKVGKRHVWKVIAGLVITAFIFFMMTVFSSANIAIELKSTDVTIDGTITIPSDTTLGVVRSENIEVSRTESAQVSASGEELVERKASGKIIIYNNFSDEPQRLITRTRFESKEGKIYRIPESIVVPGKTNKGRGEIEVLIYADEAGGEYNVEKTTFTIPGFKNDSTRYSSFGAESSTKIEGGFIGKIKKVADSDKNRAYIEIDNKLKEVLTKEIEAQVPDGLILISGAEKYSSSELTQEDTNSGAILKKQGTLTAKIFNTEDLSKEIFRSSLGSKPEWQNIDGRVVDFSNLSVSLRTLDSGDIEVRISGSTTIEAYVDEEEVKSKLIGENRSNISEILSGYPGIKSARATVRPSWKKSFPDNIAKIYIEYIK